MKVWLVEDWPPYEAGHFIGAYATEELANEAAARERYPDWVAVWEEDVITELLPDPIPAKPPYQVIP